MSSLLEIRDLSFAYGKQVVLEEVNFSIEQGDFVGITGANGTGKSTLMKLILGQLTPTGGSIHLFDRELPAFKDWNLIGYVPQISLGSASGFPATTMEVVLMGLYSQIGFLHTPKKKHRQQALAALHTVGMEAYAKKQIGALSGGQQQRVMIAKALVSGPALLLLDEPTTGIDRESTQGLLELLAKLNREGMTILLITHDSKVLPFVKRTLTFENNTVIDAKGEDA